METFLERQSTLEDKEWIWGLYEALLKEPISEQWGWDLEYQQSFFADDLAYDKFKILSAGGIDKACYVVNAEPDQFYLKMLLVDERFQQSGIGKRIIKALINLAQKMQLPIRLSVIKANPVVGFYLKQGFIVTGEEDGSIEMEFIEGIRIEHADVPNPI